MALYQTACFRVKPEARAMCGQAIRDFVTYVAQQEQV
jgi:hypothetical protein